jgi:AraC-like DNA-binding protein
VTLRDTTTPFTPKRHATIFVEQNAPAGLLRSQALRFELIGLHYADSGPQWDSHGRAEGDCFHHIDMTIKSDARIRHGDVTLNLLPGHAYFFPGNTPIIRECHGIYEVLWLRFRCSWFSGLDPLLHWPERTPLCLGPWDPQEWRVPLDGHALPDSRMLLRWQARLTRWFADALPDVDAILSEHARAHAQFSAVFDLIDENLTADLRLEMLAKAYGGSVQTFSRNFTKVLGQSPKTYLSRRLNQQAIRLLLSSRLAIKEIAAALRFSDEYYFSRFFTKMNRVAPSRYRQDLQKRDARQIAPQPASVVPAKPVTKKPARAATRRELPSTR